LYAEKRDIDLALVMKNTEIQILTEYKKIDLPERFVELDIGCGKGSFTASLAEKYPDRHILAADVMIGRLRKLNKRVNRMELGNMELLRVEAGALINYFLPPGSINRIHILCPDPWPKAKHKGHRLISSEFISRLTVVLKHNGVFHFSTDDEPYFKSAVKIVEVSGLFETRDFSLIEDIRDIKSDFERIWESKGKAVHHISWQKCDGNVEF
jgi:tRNA (guanine-N7-)-methyltransferase